MKKLLKEFNEFAFKGNVMNLAIGVIIGAAFQGVVSSLTTNILSPVIGIFMRENFDSLELGVLGVTIKYGAFLTSLINFLIMAFVVFLLLKLLTETSKRISIADTTGAAGDGPPRKCPYCRMQIDDEASRCPHCTSSLTP
jgi:large conductance mechanosensitive channel